jgi:hypothetical protein
MDTMIPADFQLTPTLRQRLEESLAKTELHTYRGTFPVGPLIKFGVRLKDGTRYSFSREEIDELLRR